jgi:hypothetical protein
MARYPRKPEGTNLGHHRPGGLGRKPAPPKPALATWEDSTSAQHPVLRGTTRRAGIVIPEANEYWHPAARSWFNSLALSGQSDFYEASDWATAVMAAQIYDSFMRTRQVSLLPQFLRLSERLGVTVVDRKRARIELDEPGEPTDADEEAADATVLAWRGHLGLVPDDDGTPGKGA